MATKNPLGTPRFDYQMVRLPAGETPAGDGWSCFHSYATYDDVIIWLWSRVVIRYA